MPLFLPGAVDDFFFAWSRSRLRNLGCPEPEPPKKVAAPQHCTQPNVLFCFLMKNVCEENKHMYSVVAPSLFCSAPAPIFGSAVSLTLTLRSPFDSEIFSLSPNLAVWNPAFKGYLTFS